VGARFIEDIKTVPGIHVDDKISRSGRIEFEVSFPEAPPKPADEADEEGR
jgi:hypothetical protein